MTGADVKAQVMYTLSSTLLYSETYDEAHAALAPCVVLTAEEAAEIRELLDDVWEQFAYETTKGKVAGGLSTLEWLEAVRKRALLTPERGDEATEKEGL